MQLRPVFSRLGSPVRHGSRALALALTASLLVSAAPQVSEGAELTVLAVNLRNAKGVVRACLTEQAAKFPTCDDPAKSYTTVVKAGGSVTLAFRDVRPGRYGVALLHDENNNGKADRAAMMIPVEGFGFSRDAKVRFGPPKFSDAALDIAAGSSQKITVKMRYLL